MARLDLPGFDFELEGYQAGYVTLLIEGLAKLVKRTIEGDEMAALQIEAIHKMTFPEIFDLQKSNIEKVAELDRTASGKDAAALARGYAVRRWMSRLSYVVAPTLEGERLSPGSFIRILSEKECILKEHHSRAREKQHPRMTLQSLAIKVYLGELERQGEYALTEKRLTQDLRITGRYDEKYDPNAEHWQLLHVFRGDPLPVRIISNKWQRRKYRDRI